MKQIKDIHGIVVPLKQANIDTDAIMPKQFLKSIKRTGYGEYLFDAWRYMDKGEPGMDCSRRPRQPDFVLNQKDYQNAKILLTEANFGCGSSREHAVWGLVEYGFEAIVAPSFADIFSSNAMKNGLLLIQLPERDIQSLFEEVLKNPGESWEIQLEAQTLKTHKETYAFEISASDKEKLLKGLDDIGVTLEYREQIKAYEKHRAIQEPWIFH